MHTFNIIICFWKAIANVLLKIFFSGFLQAFSYLVASHLSIKSWHLFLCHYIDIFIYAEIGLLFCYLQLAFRFCWVIFLVVYIIWVNWWVKCLIFPTAKFFPSHSIQILIVFLLLLVFFLISNKPIGICISLIELILPCLVT